MTTNKKNAVLKKSYKNFYSVLNVNSCLYSKGNEKFVTSLKILKSKISLSSYEEVIKYLNQK